MHMYHRDRAPAPSGGQSMIMGNVVGTGNVSGVYPGTSNPNNVPADPYSRVAAGAYQIPNSTAIPSDPFSSGMIAGYPASSYGVANPYAMRPGAARYPQPVVPMGGQPNTAPSDTPDSSPINTYTTPSGAQATQPQAQPQPQRPPDPWGLLGLSRVLKMTDKDLNVLTLGTDLTTLGLNLTSQDVLYATFASPWANTPLKRREPEFHIPLCYYIQPLPPPTEKMSLFSDETLFYIFYSMPQDALQMAASAELYSRDWRYHTELRTWFHRIPGVEPIVKTASYECGSYIYFDVTTWSQARKDNFKLEYDKLESQLKL